MNSGVIRKKDAYPASWWKGFIFQVSIAIFALTVLGSCSTLRKTSSPDKPLKERSSKYLLKQLAQQQLAAEWFSARARITYQDPYETVKLTSYIRMQKDSFIWMNFKKLSVEAARVLITPDSVWIIDRLNNQYAGKDFAFIQKNFHLPVNFTALQNMLLGNPVFLTTDLEASVEEQQYRLDGNSKDWKTTYGLDGITFALQQVLLQDVIRGRSLYLEQEDYQELEPEKKFSYIRNLRMVAEDQGPLELEVEFSKVELNVPKNIRFEIPKRYTKID